MSYLRIHSIKMSNIRCFKDFEVKFTEGTNILTGENGSGKSTILTSIGYGLFGSDYLNGLPLKKKDMVKWGENEGKIALEFQTPQGRFLCKHVINIEKGRDRWTVEDLGKKKPLSDKITESRKLVSTLVDSRIDVNIYKNALCSLQGELSKLLDADTSEREKQMRKILGLEQYKKAATHLKKSISKANEEIDKHQEKMNLIEERLQDPDSLKEEIKGLEESKKQFSKDLSSIETDMGKIKKDIAGLEEIEKKLASNRNLLSNRIRDQENKENEKNNTLKKLDLEIKSLGIEIEGQKNALNLKTTYRKKIDENRQKLENLSNQINSHQSEKTRLAENEKTLDEKIAEINDLQASLTKVLEDKELSQIREEYIKLDQLIKDSEEISNSLNKELKNNKQEVIDLKQLVGEQEQKVSILLQEVKDQFGIGIEDLSKEEEKLREREIELDQEQEKIRKETAKVQKTIGEISAQQELSKQTLELLSLSHEKSSCPTCFRTFVDSDTSDIVSRHQNALENYERDLEEKTQALKTNEKQAASISNSIQKLGKKEKVLIGFKERGKNLPDWKKIIERASKDIEQLVEKQNELQKQLLDVDKDKIQNLKEDFRHLGERIKLIESTEEKLKAAKTLKLRLEKEIKKQESSLNQEENANNVKEQKRLKIINKTLDENIGHLDNILQHYSLITNADQDIKQLSMQISGIKEDINKQEKALDIEKLEELKTRRDQLGPKLGEVREKLSSIVEKDLPEKNEQLKRSIKDTKEIEKIDQELTTLTSVLPRMQRTREVLEALPNSLISKISGQVSNQITATLRRFLPNRGYERAIFNKDASITLINRGQPVDRNLMSFGERTVLGVALRMSLADYVAPLQFLIMDEPTNYLDKERIEEFIEIIDREGLFQGKNGQLILVTHRDEFNRNASKSIRIGVKNNQDRYIDKGTTEENDLSNIIS